MASKGSSKKGKGQRSSSGPEPHNGLAGCSCEGCLRMAETSSRMDDRDPFNVRFSQMRKKLEKCVKSVPTRLLKPGMKGPALQKCLSDLTFVRMEEEYDTQLKEAHTLAKFDPARPILAAGLYSESEECQVSALMCFQSYVKDGDFERAFPPYCKPLQRHTELLDSEDYEVVSYAAMSIALLCNSPYYCETNPIGRLQHQFYELGAVEKMMAFLSKQPSKRKQRGPDTLEVAKMECCYALASLLANHQALNQPWVPDRVLIDSSFIDSLVKLTYCPQKGGEVQRMALMCLGSVAKLSDEVAEAVVKFGGKEAAEKALKAPFADSNMGRDQETKRRAVIILKALMSVVSQKKPLPSLDEIDGMSVKALKELLAEHSVSTQGCVEKGDLQKKARALVEAPAPPPPSPKPAPPAKAEANGSSEQGKPTRWPVDKGQYKFLPSAVEVLAMSTKEIKSWLQRLDISTAGCLERQDLALKLMAIVQVVHSETVSEAGNDDDDATPPSMDLALGTDLDDDAGTSKALMDFFNTATNEAARSAAEEALAQLSVSGDLPSDISLERAIQLVVKGKKTSIRRMGLTVVVAAIDKSGHELRHRMDAAGVLKATVRMLHETDPLTRWEVIEALCNFAKSPSLAPKIWGYGAMGPILEEVRKPEVLFAISKRSRTVVNADAMSVIMLSGLRLLANMLIPSSMEELCKPEGGPVLAHANKGTSNLDAFTRKLGRWLVKNQVHEQIHSMLTIARVSKWSMTRQIADTGVTISVVQQGGRILQLLIQNPDTVDAVFALPEIMVSMSYFIEQWKTSPEECGVAAMFLMHLLTHHESKVEGLWKKNDMARTAKLLKASMRPDSTAGNFTARSVLLSLLEQRLSSGNGVNTPPSSGKASLESARFLCQRLAEEKSVVGAEYIVKRAMKMQKEGEVTQEQLYEHGFWPLLAGHAASAASPYLLVQFSESFAITPVKLSDDLPTPLAEPVRSKAILQVLEKGVVKTLEPLGKKDQSALVLMNFYKNIAQGIEVRGRVAKAILTDPDLMPFLLRFGLMEEGCKLGIATAKLALKELFKLNPARLTVGDKMVDLPPSSAVWITNEMRPGLPPDSLRYDYDDCFIYVGPVIAAEAAIKSQTFMTNTDKLIDEYRQEKEEEKKGVVACGVCGKTPARSCGRCHKQAYCGRECQTQDWKKHKVACKASGA